jgi:uncharacterized protein involved in outer membrane biogenesis
VADPLAEPADVEKTLQRPLTTEEEAACADVLDAASNMFRTVAMQQFTPSISTVRLKVNGGRVRLDQRPCTDVQIVIDNAGKDVSFTQNGSWLTVDLDSSQFVTVTYAHGGDIPPQVRNAVAEMAARALCVPEDVIAGAKQLGDTVGPFSYQASWGSSGQAGTLRLSESDRAVAQSYLWTGGQVVVQAI